MAKVSYKVRAVGDQLDEYCSIASEGLLTNDPSIWKVYVKRVGPENLRGVFQDSHLVGGLAFYRMGQWFGGRRLDCAGYSGVAINPISRGKGACGVLLRETLRENYEDGFPLCSLYASTQTLYRSVGFEHAGLQIKYSIPITSLENADRDLPVHRFSSPPIDLLERVALDRAQATNGNLARTEGLWERLIHPYDGNQTNTYFFGDLDEPEGFVILRSGTRDGGVPQPLTCTDMAANTPAALSRLMSLVHDHRSMCDRFIWFGQPNDPLHFVAQEQWIEVPDCLRWMTRILNVPSALEQRGYGSAVNETLYLNIIDPLIPENEGSWVLVVRDGTASVERGGQGGLSMNIRALAPLFSGLFSASQLARMGAISPHDQSQCEAADRIFAGPSPWMPEIF